MNQYDNTNRGAIFTNQNKQSEKHPDMQGTINVDGVELYISGWWKQPKNGGDEFLSVALKPKEAQAPKPAQQASRGRPKAAQEYKNKEAPGFDEQDDSDVPF